MQDTSSSSVGWPKKSKLVEEEGAVAVGSIVEEGFGGSDNSRDVGFSDAKDKSDGDRRICAM